MAKVSKQVVDKDLREKVFAGLFEEGIAYMADMNFVKINDRQYGILLTDLNGEQRYVRIGAIVAELREDMTAEELMNSEIEKYNASQEKKAEAAKKKADKIAADKAKREAEKEKKNAE